MKKGTIIGIGCVIASAVAGVVLGYKGGKKFSSELDRVQTLSDEELVKETADIFKSAGVKLEKENKEEA